MYFNLIYKISRILERVCAMAQGKGYGSASIHKEIAVVRKFINFERKYELLIDVGANVGNYTYHLRKFYKNAEIHLFEPSSFNIKKLQQRFENDPLIYINPTGISRSDETLPLYSNELGNGCASLSKRRTDHLNLRFRKIEKVNVIRFEKYWINKLKRKKITLAKLDIEGHELDALQGFGSAIQATKLIQFEFGGCNLDTHTTFQDFYYFFKDHKFEIFRIGPFGAEKITQYREIDESYLTTNFLARNTMVL